MFCDPWVSRNADNGSRVAAPCAAAVAANTRVNTASDSTLMDLSLRFIFDSLCKVTRAPRPIWTFAFSLPIAILGYKTEHFVLVNAFNTLYQFWIHTETIGKFPRWITEDMNETDTARIALGSRSNDR